MKTPKLTLGDRIPSGELKNWQGAGEWVELVADKHAGAALIVWRMEDDDRSPECEALARLLAGASEMLDELRAQLERCYNPFEPDNQSIGYHRLKALIDKVTGVAS